MCEGETMDIWVADLWRIYVEDQGGKRALNAMCPQCGDVLSTDELESGIRANETGYYYCSEDCCEQHVIDNASNGGY